MKEKIKAITPPQFIGVKGVVTVNTLEPKSKLDFKMVDTLRRNRDLLITAGKEIRARIYQENFDIQKALEESCTVKRFVQDNIVTTAGLTQVAKGLSTNLTTLSELEVNYTAVGTGSTVPVAGDTTLTTEVFRNVVNTLNFSNNIFFASMFIDFADDADTYKEAGLFINATAAADSGTMFDHVLLNSPTGIVKSLSQILTISFQITFTPV